MPAENVTTIQDGKVSIPSEMLKELGLSEGRAVLLVSDGEEVRIVNPLMDAMRKFQEGMKGAAEEVGWTSDDDVVAYIKEIRAELAEERAAQKNESIHRHKYSDFVHSMA